MQFLRVCRRSCQLALPLCNFPPVSSSQWKFFSSQVADESSLKKTLLRYRANASKSRDKAVKLAYLQLANEIQAKLTADAAASSANNLRNQTQTTGAAEAVAITVAGSSKNRASALKIRLPSSFKAAAVDTSKSG
jgi:hypothetical protein